jgi:flagellar biosynthesis chaperone FliJ
MRKFLISAAVAASALAVATPAAAQYQPILRGQPGYAWGYGQNYNYRGHASNLQARVDHVQRQISNLAQRRMITRNEHQNLQRDAREIERRLRHDARDGRGLNANEMYNTEHRIARLEQKIARDVRDGHGWNNAGYGYGNGYNNGAYYDRDRDGRDDRYENDRGTRRD